MEVGISMDEQTQPRGPRIGIRHSEPPNGPPKEAKPPQTDTKTTPTWEQVLEGRLFRKRPVTHGSCDELITAYLEFIGYAGGFLSILQMNEVGSFADESIGPQFFVSAAHLWGAGSRLLDALGSNLYRELKNTPVENVYETDKREAADGARAKLERDFKRLVSENNQEAFDVYRESCKYMHSVCMNLCSCMISMASLIAYSIAAQYTEGRDLDVPRQIARVHEVLSFVGSILTIHGIPLGAMLLATEESMAEAEAEAGVETK